MNPRRKEIRVRIQREVDSSLRHHSYTERIEDKNNKEDKDDCGQNEDFEKLGELSSSRILFSRKRDHRK